VWQANLALQEHRIAPTALWVSSSQHQGSTIVLRVQLASSSELKARTRRTTVRCVKVGNFKSKKAKASARAAMLAQNEVQATMRVLTA
jgi:hypothetical protein